MTAVNQFKPWATGVGANTLDAAAFAGLATLLQGFASGTASSQQVNTILRQVSSISAMIGQFIADNAGLDANDDGNIGVLQDRFELALQTLLQPLGVYFITDTSGTANKIVGASLLPPASYSDARLIVVKKNNQQSSGVVTANLWGLGDVPVDDNSGAALSTGALKASSFYVLTPNGSTELRVLGGAATYTTVSNLTANSGKAIAVQVSGAVDVDMTQGTTHNSSPSATDTWMRQKSDKSILTMSTSEFITWLNANLTFPAVSMPSFGVNVGDHLLVAIGVPAYQSPYNFGWRMGTTISGSQLASGTSPAGVTAGGWGAVGDGSGGWSQTAVFDGGSIAGTWKLRGWTVTMTSDARYMNYIMCFVREA